MQRITLSRTRRIAVLSGLTTSELRNRIGRYGRIVRKIGPYDTMIIINAKLENAILMTGDWSQGKYYMGITGIKPIYIPIKQLV